jgi:putative intracellular protease/amidase
LTSARFFITHPLDSGARPVEEEFVEAQWKILMIVTSHARLGDTAGKTGYWLEELAAPYVEFTGAGAVVDIASLEGGAPPVDPRSEHGPKSEAVQAFLADAVAARKIATTLRLADVRETYDAYFVVGGHGVMWDLASSPAVGKLLGTAFDAGKVVSSVCHGAAVLSEVRLASGRPLVAQRRVTGFSNDEEQASGLAGIVPFEPETRLRELGALYEHGPNFSVHTVRDGRLVTGQNPQSSAATALAVVTTVREVLSSIRAAG